MSKTINLYLNQTEFKMQELQTFNIKLDARFHIQCPYCCTRLSRHYLFKSFLSCRTCSRTFKKGRGRQHHNDLIEITILEDCPAPNHPSQALYSIWLFKFLDILDCYLHAPFPPTNPYDCNKCCYLQLCLILRIFALESKLIEDVSEAGKT